MASTVDDPHAWLAAYSVKAHYFMWAVAHGALDDIEAARVEGEDWLQPALLPDVEPAQGFATRIPPVAYRSRAPNRVDVMVQDKASRKARRMLGISLRRERVLRA